MASASRLLAALATVLALALVVAASGQRPPAASAACPNYDAYPGDDDKTAVARWMGAAMRKGGLPPELPVMASLVETNLRNLPPGDTDYAGFFQIRVSYWNKGEYAGFPENPQLQVKWFLDRALEVRQQRVAAGDAAFGKDPSQWGEWIADVERPASQYRGRYQPRLAEAQGLLGPVCEEPGSGLPPPDLTGPALRLGGRRLQRGLKARALLVRVRCPEEACAVGATAGCGSRRSAASSSRHPRSSSSPARPPHCGSSSSAVCAAPRAARWSIGAGCGPASR